MCKDECSLYCVNKQLCDYESGVCEGGCMNGWIGERCMEGKCVVYWFVGNYNLF